MTPPTTAALLFNEVRFEKMACGDLAGFYELADEYFQDVKQRMNHWPELLAGREFKRLSEEFHRCKGGAAMFGLDRLYSLFGTVETDSGVETEDRLLERLASELQAAQEAVAVSRGKSSDV